jgi:hypothetical protein
VSIVNENCPHLIPCFIQHNGTTHWNPGLVSQEALESLLMVVTPMAEEWTNMEKAMGEFLESHRRK